MLVAKGIAIDRSGKGRRLFEEVGGDLCLVPGT
jgi:hypothetical protein